MATDDAQFADFVRRESPRLLWSARMLCSGDPAGAEDLVQDALLETYRKWRRIKDPNARVAYTRRIMARAASRHRRHPSKVIEILRPEPPEHATGADDGTVGSRMVVWSALAELSPMQRAVVVLRYYEDLDEKAISDVLGCSRGSVKTHASRALASLGTQLADSDTAPLTAREKEQP